MLHQWDARGQHRNNPAQREGRNQNQAKVVAHRDLTSLENTLLHEGQAQGHHLEKYLKQRMHVIHFIYKDSLNANINRCSYR